MRVGIYFRFLLGVPQTNDAPYESICDAIQFRAQSRLMTSPWHDLNSSALSRRQMLRRAGAGFGMLALAGLLEQQGLLGAPREEKGTQPSTHAHDILASKPPHF